MPSGTQKVANHLIGHLHSLEATRTRMERLFSDRLILRKDIEQVYEGLFLEVVTSFEYFIEECFVGLLVGNIKHTRQSVQPKVSFRSHGLARDIIFAGRNYVDWLPYKNTLERSTIFFKRGFPFTHLSEADSSVIHHVIVTRNAIAHKSIHSKKQFEKIVIGSRPLPPRERTPAGFLRSIFRISPSQTRYENFVGGLALAALKIAG
jgi:hypothetical protein